MKIHNFELFQEYMKTILKKPAIWTSNPDVYAQELESIRCNNGLIIGDTVDFEFSRFDTWDGATHSYTFRIMEGGFEA